MKTAKEFMLDPENSGKGIILITQEYAEYYHQEKLKEKMPSDEEIDKALNYYPTSSVFYDKGVLVEGAQWLKNELLK